jgi:IstB-like ATP binding protein
MLHQPTIEKLMTMHMEPFVEAWRAFEQDENAQQLSFEEKLSLMVDRLWTWRQNQALARRLRYAKLRGNACVEDIDYRTARGLDRNLMRSLAVDSGWWHATSTFSSSGQPAWAKAIWPALWLTKPAATAT